MLYYVEIKKTKEAFLLARHTKNEIENCIDFINKAGVNKQWITLFNDLLAKVC
jgi:hypothetical protein